MMQSVAADVFHSIETAGSHVYIEALPSLLHMSGTSAGAKRGLQQAQLPKGGTRADPGGAESLLHSCQATIQSKAPPVRRGSETAEG